MRSNDYIDFMNALDPDDELEKRILDAAETEAKPNDTGISGGEQVSGVEHYRKPVWTGRLGAMAAALAVLVAVGGGVYGVMGHQPKQPETSQIVEDIPPVTEIAPEPTTEAPAASVSAYPENSYDMTTKDGIVAKMLNSVDFYERASGVCVHLPYTAENCGETVEFSYDTVTGEYRMKCESLELTNTFNDLAEGAFPEGFEHYKYSSGEVYFDPVEERYYDIDYKGFKDVYYAYDADKKLGRGDTPLNAEAVLERKRLENSLDTLDGDIPEIPWESPRNGCPLNISPKTIVENCLANYESWLFTDDSFCGRDVLRIDGVFPPGNNVWTTDGHDTTNCRFCIHVDKETGMVLKYVEYYDDGNVYDLFVMHEIKFDDEAAPIKKFDPAGKTLYNYEDDENGVYGFNVNSKGETYGNAYGLINLETRSSLPDLIEFGRGYAYTDEIFAQVDDLRIMTYNKHLIRRGDEEPAYKLNIYTSEGEYIETIEYYDGYIDE